MSDAQTITKRIARGMLAVVLAIAFMPFMALTSAPQADAAAEAPANSLLNAYVPPIPDQTYTSEEITPKPVVMLGGKTLAEGTDYTLRYDANTNQGTAHIEITGIGSYIDNKIVDFEIIPVYVDPLSTTVTLSETKYYYDGARKTPTVTVVFKDKVLRHGQDYYVMGMNDQDLSSVGLHTLSIKCTGNYGGFLSATFEILEPTEDEESGIKSPANEDSKPTDPDAPSIAMYRLYNPNSGEHFYTADESERDSLVGAGWEYEMVGWYAPEQGDAVYRLYNAAGGEHHYTMDAFERSTLETAGWTYEGIGWYSDSTYGVALRRQYNPNEFANNHNYTASTTEFDYNIGLGWRDEGIAWYGVASTA